MGLKESQTLIAEIGDTIELTKNTIKRGEKFSAGSKFVDGVGIDGTDSFVLRDRIHLSEDGLVVVVVGASELSAEVVSVELISKGLVLDESVVKEAKSHVINTLANTDLRAVADENELAGIIRRSIKNYLFKATKKHPMILPVVLVV